MPKDSVAEAERRLSLLLDAAKGEGVDNRGDDRDVAVVLSPQEYERLLVLNAEAFQRLCDRVAARAATRGLSEETVFAMLAEED